MIRIVYSLMTVALILALAFTGCTKRSDSGSGVWNSETSTFSIENEKLNYTLPTDASYWAIAEKKNLPSDMLFFGVDSSEGIGVGIFRVNQNIYQSQKAEDLTDADIEVILKQLSNPYQGQTVAYEKIDKNRCELAGNTGWNFIVEHKILDSAVSHDIIPVFYSGYIFDGIINPYGLVVISNINPNDSIGRNQLMKYTSGLSFK